MKWNHATGEAELGDLAEDIAFLTRTLRAYLRAEVKQLRSELGIEPGEIAMLRLIGLNPGISQNDLAAAVVIKKSAVTKIVGDLLAKGLIARERVAADRRYKALTLTSRGRRQVETLKTRVDALYGELFAGFDTEEKDRLFGSLRKLIDAASQRQTERDASDAD